MSVKLQKWEKVGVVCSFRRNVLVKQLQISMTIKATPSRLTVSHFPPVSIFVTPWIDSLFHYWWHQAATGAYERLHVWFILEPTSCIALAIWGNWKTLKAGTTETGTGTGPHHSLLAALTTRFQFVGLLVVH